MNNWISYLGIEVQRGFTLKINLIMTLTFSTTLNINLSLISLDFVYRFNLTTNCFDSDLNFGHHLEHEVDSDLDFWHGVGDWNPVAEKEGDEGGIAPTILQQNLLLLLL